MEDPFAWHRHRRKWRPRLPLDMVLMLMTAAAIIVLAAVLWRL